MDPIDIKEFDKLPKFIAVEGPIGAGKTTLTKLLADSLNYETFLEKPSEVLSHSLVCFFLEEYRVRRVSFYQGAS